MLMNCVFSFLAAALLGFSEMSGSYVTLIVGRIVVGFNAGASSFFVPCLRFLQYGDQRCRSGILRYMQNGDH